MRNLTTLNAFVCSGLSLTIMSCAPRLNGPTIIVDRTEHNWGKVDPGSTVEAVFEMKNAGDRPLLIGKLTVSCGCTQPELKSATINPGEKAPLKVRFTLPLEPGSVSHKITIPSNDTFHPTTVLYLYAQAWSLTRWSPQTLDFGRLKVGNMHEQEFQVYSSDHTPFAINYIKPNLSGLTVMRMSPPASLPLHQFKVSYKSSTSLGFQLGGIMLTTDRRSTPILKVPFYAQVVGPIVTVPDQLQVEKEEIGRKIQRTFMFRAVDVNDTIRLSAVEGVSPWIVLKSDTSSGKNGVTFAQVTFKFPEDSGGSGGGLQFKFSSPDDTSVTVPLSIRGWAHPITVSK